MRESGKFEPQIFDVIELLILDMIMVYGLGFRKECVSFRDTC